MESKLSPLETLIGMGVLLAGLLILLNYGEVKVTHSPNPTLCQTIHKACEVYNEP